MRSLLLAWFCLLCIPTVICANPSDKEPLGPLDLHGQEIAPELHATAKQLFDKSNASLLKIEALFKANKVDKIDVALVGKTHGEINQMRRIGSRLRQLGEPAGAEFVLRAQAQAQVLNKVVQAMQNVPNAQQGLSAIRIKATQVAQMRAKQIPKLQKLLEQKNWNEADKELYEIFDEVEPYMAFLNVDDRASVLSAFRDVAGAIEMGANAQRIEIAKNLLEKRRAELRPDLPKLLADAQAATASLGKSGKHNIGGKDLTGPELIAHFDQAWRQAHVAHCKALGVEWAREAAMQQAATPERKELLDAYAKFTAEIGPALAALIKADTTRVNATGVAALYTAYLPAVADLLDHATGAPIEAPLTSALDELAKKSPALLGEVTAYRTITDESLRWRARVAQEQAKAKAAEHETVTQRAVVAFKRSEATSGLWAPESSSTAKARLSDAAALILINGAPKAIGQKATTAAITALPGTSQAGIARYHERVYTRVPLAMEKLTAAATALQAALFVTDKAPPLSLAATQAIRSAQRGDLVQAGGTISGIYLEGHITRFATLPEAAALLLPLGTSPDSYGEFDPLEQVVLRFDLTPTWLQHKYFVVVP